MSNTLNRKYLMQAIDGSLERLQHDFVDVLYCHRADPDTTIEETVWAMHDIISSGKALYWGTSEWSADDIRAAIEFAERHHLHKPVTEQSQYNLLERTKVEDEYARIIDDYGYGNTIWSPLASGMLTGKYRDGIPEDSRGALAGYEWLAQSLVDPDTVATRRAAAADRRTPRVLDGPTRARVVRLEPTRLHRDHGRQPRQPGPRQLRRPRRDPTHHRRRQRGDRRSRQTPLSGAKPIRRD